MALRVLAHLAFSCGPLALTIEVEDALLLPFGKAVREAYFQFSNGTIYFNHGGFGATPRRVRQAMEAYTDQMEAQPTQWFAQSGYHSIIGPARMKLAKMIGARADDLVFLDNASGGMNAVLRSLFWKSGDILLMIGSVYPVFPNTASWLERQYGIRTMRVQIEYPVKGPDDYIETVRAFLRKLREADRVRVRLALLDHISSYPPVTVPVKQLSRLVKDETSGNALVFVDGAHALGQIPINLEDLRSTGVDFYVMDGHKWFLSPHGSGMLWVAQSAQDIIQPDVISSENGPGTSFQSRFDYIGTRDYTPWCAVGDAIEFRANELGGEERIYAYIHDMAVWAAGMLSERWETEAVAPSSMTPGMACLRLPIPKSLPLEQQRACATTIDQELLAKHKMQIIPFTLATPNETHWARISAQVYLERSDFESLASNVLDIATGCLHTASLHITQI